ncbi:MAG: hypothetical protein HRT45_18460 [Bdellovibrionales bacterium]|nr:hypothetical protein [Bdellovibrionales bacterium]
MKNTLVFAFASLMLVFSVAAEAGPGRALGELLGSGINGNTTADVFRQGFRRRDDMLPVYGPELLRTETGTAQVFRYTPRGANGANPDLVRVQSRIENGGELRFLDINLGLTRSDYAREGAEVLVPPRILGPGGDNHIRVVRRQGEQVVHRTSFTVREVGGQNYRQTTEQVRWFGGGDQPREGITINLDDPANPRLIFTPTSPDGDVYLAQVLNEPLAIPEGHSVVHAEIVGARGEQLTLFMLNENGELVRQSARLNTPVNSEELALEVGPLGPRRPISPAEREVLTHAEMRVYQTESLPLTNGDGPGNTSVGGGIGGLGIDGAEAR